MSDDITKIHEGAPTSESDAASGTLSEAPSETRSDEATAESSESRLDSARQRFAQVASGVGDRVGKLKEGAGGAREKVREQAEHLGTATRERYETTVENVRHGYGKVSKDLEHLNEDVNEYVRDNPGRSVLMAAGIGFLVGLLLRGGRR